MARELSLRGPSVERINEVKPRFKNVVVGEILEIKKHPNADKLSLVKVSVGKNKPILKIVCGAANIKINQKVPVALPGAALPGGFKISKQKVRGETSEGMLCSEKELGISEDNQGIFILSPEAILGMDLAKTLDLEDQIFDAEITTNRPDALGMIGFAREASVITGEKFLYNKKSRITNQESRIKSGKLGKDKKLMVRIEDKKLCPRYLTIVMDSVKVKDSPWWMRKRLMAAGVRSINNIVDITNYVMLEYGQPMHAFDYDKLQFLKHKTQNTKHKFQTKKIIIRHAKNGENIKALDGNSYKLSEKDLVIADAEKLIAVAGVMGGEETAVDENTRTIILESANFDPLSVRKTSRSLNLYSDSSARFEKGLSVELPYPALLRAVELVQDLAGGEIASEIIDQKTKKYQPITVNFNPESAERFLGIKISLSKIKKILTGLGFEIKQVGRSKNLKAIVPYWRDKDIEAEIDLVEEIARIYGYHNLPSKLPAGEIPETKKDWKFHWENEIKNILVGAGMAEVYSYSFISEKLIKDCGLNLNNHLKLLNPLNKDLEYMRCSLISSLLKIAAENQKIKDKFKIFEIANVYFPKRKDKLPDEKLRLTGIFVGNNKEEKMFFEAKGAIELMLKKVGVAKLEFKKPSGKVNFWDQNKTAEIIFNGETLGNVGIIEREILSRLKIKKNVAAFDFDFEKLVQYMTDKKVYSPLPKYPAIELDLSVVLDKKITWREIKEAVEKADKKLIKKLELFDVYEGGKLPGGKKSAAFRITCRADERTLKDKEAEKIQEKVIKILEGNFGGKIRGI